MPARKHIFVGRKTELDYFELLAKQMWQERLIQPTGHRVKPRVFLPSGIGGIGKTELAKKCAEVARKIGWITADLDWEKVSLRPTEPIQLMNSIAEKLEALFGRDAIREYLDDRDKVAVLREKVKGYGADHPEDLQKVAEEARKLTELTPDLVTKTALNVALDLAPRAVGKAQQLFADLMVARQRLKVSEAALFKNPDVYLAKQLVKALCAAARDHPLLISLDTCEVLSPDLEESLRDLIVVPAVEQGSSLILIILGRLSQYHERIVEDGKGNRRPVKGYGDYIADPPPVEWDLSVFADPEIAEYLKDCELDPSPEMVHFVKQTSRGVPFAVQLIAEALYKLGPERVRQDFPPKDLAEYDQQGMVTEVVRRFLRYCLDNPTDQDRLRALAMTRHYDMGALAALWELKGGQRAREILTELEARYGFVQGNGALNDVVRQFLRENLRGDDKQTAQNLGGIAVEYYRPLWETESADLKTLADRALEKRWQGLTLDLLNGLCWSDEMSAVRFLAARALEVLEFNYGFATGLIDQAREFREAKDWWSGRSLRRFDAIASAIEGRGQQEMDGLESLLRESSDLELVDAQCCLLQIRRAKNLKGQGKHSEALRVCLEAERISPGDASVREALAETYGSLGTELGFEDGIAVPSPEGKLASEHAVALDPKKPSYHFLLGTQYRYLPHEQEAIAEYQKAIELDPQSVYAHNGLGAVYSDQGRRDEAIVEFQKAIELDPQSTYPHNNLGNVYSDQGRRDEAIAEFQKAIELDPQSAYPHNGLGNVYRDQGRRDEAIAEYQKAIELDPQSAYPHNGLGAVYRDQGRRDEAIAEYQMAIELDPQSAYPHNGLGAVYRDQGRRDEAIAEYQMAIELDPQFAYPHNGLGAVYSDQGRRDEAIAEYQKAIELDPQLAAPHNNLASEYFKEEKFDDAIRELNERIELLPSNAFAPIVMLGIFQCSRGSPESNETLGHALAQWDVAWRQQLQTPSGLLENKAKALLCIGKKAEALQALTEAIAAMSPGDTIDFDDYSLIQAAPNPPDGIEQMIEMLKGAQASREIRSASAL